MSLDHYNAWVVVDDVVAAAGGRREWRRAPVTVQRVQRIQHNELPIPAAAAAAAAATTATATAQHTAPPPPAVRRCRLKNTSAG